MATLTRNHVNAEVEAAYDELFTKLDQDRDADTKPSEVERLLDSVEWGLGDLYRDWFHESGDPYE